MTQKTIRPARWAKATIYVANRQIALGAVEGFNNKAKVTTKKAYGFKSFDVVKVGATTRLGIYRSRRLPIDSAGETVKS